MFGEKVFKEKVFGEKVFREKVFGEKVFREKVFGEKVFGEKVRKIYEYEPACVIFTLFNILYSNVGLLCISRVCHLLSYGRVSQWRTLLARK